VHLGLPDAVGACLFDLDGVLTETAKVHDAAWKQVFDEILQDEASRSGVPFVPFDPVDDYDTYVDGKPRTDGVRDFLASRGIHPPDGSSDDPPSAFTIHGIGRKKNDSFVERIRTDGVEAYPGSVRYLHAVRDAGLRRIVVSSSANCHDILLAAGIDDLVEGEVDGTDVERDHLHGKPAPDTFLAGARLAGHPPAGCAVFEDALAGVQAGRAGAFGYVVGVDRIGGTHPADLTAHGADVVLRDLADLLDGGPM
jgi:beta-phosphoglucomutase family hydrolase